MSIKTLVIGVMTAGIALGSLGLATTDASAAMTMKKPIHHMLTCKVGYAPHKVKSHGKWVWVCHKVHVVHKPMMPKHKK